MIKELIYLGEGIEKRIGSKIQELQFEKLFLDDFKNMAEEIGLATKKDIEELKDYIKNRA